MGCLERGKSSSQKSQPLSHQKVHIGGEEPFRWTQPGEAFGGCAVTVKRQERPHPCALCGKRFPHHTVLVKHQKIHAREALNSRKVVVAGKEEEEERAKEIS
ncbi:hypothetical protein E2320_014475 [Naja naja]|nr:hypothetical protein E2320_014475 [Naja naja]